MRADIYIGRVAVTRVTPPQTIELVKRLLCNIEHIPFADDLDLYATINSESPLDDAGRAEIFGDGLGPSADNPVALVVKHIPFLSRFSRGMEYTHHTTNV
jgi:hypothetical protein